MVRHYQDQLSSRVSKTLRELKKHSGVLFPECWPSGNNYSIPTIKVFDLKLDLSWDVHARTSSYNLGVDAIAIMLI